LLQDLGDIGNEAEILLTDVAVAPKPRSEETESKIRSRLSEPLQIAERYDLTVLWRREHLALAQEMRRLTITTTKPQQSDARKPDEVKVSAAESCWEVLRDVLVDSFGLDATARKAFGEYLKKAGLEKVANAVAQAAKTKDWPRATILLRSFFTQLTSRGTLKALETAIGPEAFKRLLRTFASRFVPWLGWGLMAGAVVTALWNNRERLEKCKL